ncbi:hypothetical protein ABPG74_019851 [Tetrahymena malaccensis]
MRFLVLTLLALLVIYAVKANDQDDVQKRTDCLKSIQAQSPCQASDQSCLDEKSRFESCRAGCLTNSSNDYVGCLKTKCTSTNDKIQTYANDFVKCLTTNSASLIAVLTFALLSLLY